VVWSLKVSGTSTSDLGDKRINLIELIRVSIYHLWCLRGFIRLSPQSVVLMTMTRDQEYKAEFCYKASLCTPGFGIIVRHYEVWLMTMAIII